MEFNIDFDGQSCCLYITVAAQNAIVRVIGLDADPAHPNTKFFSRDIGSEKRPFTGIKKFELPLPISPEKMHIQIINVRTGDDTGLELRDVKVTELQRRELWISEETKRFVHFAVQFCREAGYMPEGVYPSEDERFFIYYSNGIFDRRTREKIFTPARIRRDTGVMQADREKFLGYTIPMRLLILLHERMHFEHNTRYEINADLNALRIYLSYGFSQVEAIYATANIFYDSPAMIERVEEIISYIRDFSAPANIPSKNAA